MSMTDYQAKPLPFKELKGISAKTMSIHHDKLYAGYVTKKNEIAGKLGALRQAGTVEGNQTFSELRALKDGETFATNGVYLHEWYFNGLGGDGKPTGALAEALAVKYGSVESFLNYFAACGMAARGWSVLAWDAHDRTLKIYNADAHNQGGVWGALPIIVLDVYEHAYFIDYGSDRMSYIKDYLQNLNWATLNKVYQQLQTIATVQ